MPQHIVDYDYLLTHEDRLRIRFSEDRGMVLFFTIQYMGLMEGSWQEIQRYDTYHGYAHRHTFHMQSEAYIVNLTDPGDPLNDIFTEASRDIKQNFKKLRDNYLRT